MRIEANRYVLLAYLEISWKSIFFLYIAHGSIMSVWHKIESLSVVFLNLDCVACLGYERGLQRRD